MITELIDIAISAAEWYEIGQSLTQTEHFEDIKKAQPLLEKGDNTGDVEYYRRALIYLERINSEDKRAAQALAYYIKAYCYGFDNQFRRAYISLDDLDAIEISWHTMDKDTIREYKSKSIEARNEIKQMEKEYLKSLNATDTPNEKKTDKSYLILCTIFFLVILLLWCIDRFFL